MLDSPPCLRTTTPARSPNADHFIAVKFESGVWKYDCNRLYDTQTSLVEFTPVAGDLLVADIDFSLDTIVSAEGEAAIINGIDYGFRDGDLEFQADSWDGGFNDGEFGVSGTCFARSGPTTKHFYDKMGNLDVVEDSMGRQIDWDYDYLGRTTSRTNDLSQSWTYAYDAVGNLLTETDPLSHVTTYKYDNLYRLTREILHGPGGPLTGPKTQYFYDNRGDLYLLKDPVNNYTEWTYDYLHRMKSENEKFLWSDPADDLVEWYVYDAASNMFKVQAPDGRVTRYDYDALGRIWRERWVDYGGGPTSKIMYFNFDDLGRLTSDDNYSYTYDYLDRVTLDYGNRQRGAFPDLRRGREPHATGGRNPRHRRFRQRLHLRLHQPNDVGYSSMTPAAAIRWRTSWLSFSTTTIVSSPTSNAGPAPTHSQYVGRTKFIAYDRAGGSPITGTTA